MNKENPIKIITRTDKGEVVTCFSDDPFHNTGWTTHLAVPDKYGLPILEMVDMIYSSSFEEAGKNHLKLCEKIK